MKYVGIGPEHGKIVLAEDAFMYAMERITTNEEDAKDFSNYFSGFVGFMNITFDKLQEFRNDVIDWFYSGNWIKKEGE